MRGILAHADDYMDDVVTALVVAHGILARELKS